MAGGGTLAAKCYAPWGPARNACIRIGNRVFMVLPDISDTDEIGLAVEVEA